MSVYAEPGYLLFHREGTLLAQPFDARKLEVTGEPVRVADEIVYSTEDSRAGFAASQNGVLIYIAGPTAARLMQLAWYDRTGKQLNNIVGPGSPGAIRGVDLSPDGKRVAIHQHDSAGRGDVWLIELEHGTMPRLTFDSTQDNSSPIWSPQGDRLVFNSRRNGKWGLYTKLADGTGNEEKLLESDLVVTPMSWSPDGKFIVYGLVDAKTGYDQWILPLTGDRKPAALLNSPFNEFQSETSPDGKWIAYASDETGRTETYIRPFPSGAGKWQVSTTGGYFPRWGHDGKEVFFLNGLNYGKMMASQIRVAGSSIHADGPRELFDAGIQNIAHQAGQYKMYAVSPDGQQFLIPRFAVSNGDGAPPPITVIVNWAATLTR